MNIIVWGINYAPEPTGIGPYNRDLCEHLAAAGHEVRMLTAFPYYPDWEKSPADRGRFYRTDVVNGVRVHRCWHHVPRRPIVWKRIIHEATFVLTSWLRSLALPAPDVIVVVSPPLFVGPAAWLTCVFKRSRFVFHVQDLQPDAALALGLLRPGPFAHMLHAVERFTYARASLVACITAGMLRLCSDKGVPVEKQLLFPNWAQAMATEPADPGAFRERHGIDSRDLLAVYSGNLGRKQGLGVLLDAARLLPNATAGHGAPRASGEVHIVIAGNGVEKAELENRVGREALSNVLLLPLQTVKAYREMLADADVGLVTQEPGSGALFFPSKLLTIAAWGKPVVAVADPGGDLDRAVRQGSFGWSVVPGAARNLAGLLERLADDRAALEEHGSNARKWAAQFEASIVLPAFEAELGRRCQR